MRGWLEAAKPLVMIAGTFAAATVVGLTDEQRRTVVGFAQGVPEAAAPAEGAKVVSVAVTVGEEVAAGQILATLDTSIVDAEIAIAQAERGRLEAEVNAERAVVDRRTDLDIDAIERASLAAKEEQLRLDAEARALDGEIERVKGLVAEHHALASDLATLELRRASVATLAKAKPLTVTALAKQMTSASRQRDDTNAAVVAIAAKLEADLGVVQRKVELLELRRASFTLRATRRGRIASIDRYAGEMARAGEPVVHVVSATDRVVACVPERISIGLREGDRARLWVKDQRGAPFHGKTSAVGPVVAELPARCWSSPHVPMWGREITITLDRPIDTVVGETFLVALEPSPAPAFSTATTVIASAPVSSPTLTPVPTPVPTPMRVPRSLARRTRFEPSGVLAYRGKHLVVSDDTGLAGEDARKPWLFTFDAGDVAPAPVLIKGVTEIDDLESIAQGDHGEVYLLASQSWSKKGKRPPARTALLRLLSDGDDLRLDAETHLAERIEAALGLTAGARDLDVEGMAFHDGALYLGVKAPLDAHGDAMILKASAVRDLFERPDGGGLSVWGRVHLAVDVGGRPTPGGIAELAFLPHGELLIASTPSTADGEAGALYLVDKPAAGAIAPRLVLGLPSHKPEGLSVSAAGDKVLVVFDAGAKTPSYLELPWPPMR